MYMHIVGFWYYEIFFINLDFIMGVKMNPGMITKNHAAKQDKMFLTNRVFQKVDFLDFQGVTKPRFKPMSKSYGSATGMPRLWELN